MLFQPLYLLTNIRPLNSSRGQLKKLVLKETLAIEHVEEIRAGFSKYG